MHLDAPTPALAGYSRGDRVNCLPGADETPDDIAKEGKRWQEVWQALVCKLWFVAAFAQYLTYI